MVKNSNLAVDYEGIKNSEEFTEFMKRLYFPSSEKIEEISVPDMAFISYQGKGSPGSKVFQSAIASLYGIAYTLKMGFKFGKLPKPAGYFDFKVPPLEGLWWQKGSFDMSRAEDWQDMTQQTNWQWKVMIMLPAFINQNSFEEAKKQAVAKHPDVPYTNVVLEHFDEGQSIQITHIGPYADEPVTVGKLVNYSKEAGLKISGKHHEIYLGDPRRAKPERLKTVLRYPVK